MTVIDAKAPQLEIVSGQAAVVIVASSQTVGRASETARNRDARQGSES